MSDALTIVIPTYNHCDLLGECLESLQDQSGAAIKVLVVDDGSQENVSGYVREHFVGVEVLVQPTNGGFAKAVNAGLRAVTTPYVMLLNNDMTLEPDCIETMMVAMNKHHWDMVAPLVVWKDEPDKVYSAGDFVRTNGRPESYGFREPRTLVKAPEIVFAVSAGAAIYRRELFDTVGLLDEKFVAYFEDVDWCFRARLMGHTVGVTTDAVARHVGSASQSGATWWRSRQCYRNHVLLVLKNYPFTLLLRHFIPVKLEIAHQTARVISSARAEFGLLKALGIWQKAMWEWTFLLPYIFVARRRIQKARTISVDELDGMLTK
jgi:GT2 family glycosyltransferase